jgi:hypothetical protein
VSAAIANGPQWLVRLVGTVATFECKAGHQMTHDYSKGPADERMPASFLQKMAKYWGLGVQPNGRRGRAMGWCQKCQNLADKNS